MKISHFDIRAPDTKPPDGRDWTQLWHGHHRLTECWNDDLTNKSEQDFERDCFLSILSDVRKDKVTMIEVGAGFGEWNLALAGVIDHKLINIASKSYQCLAVEAEPTHFGWCKEHLNVQDIKGTAIFGAVSNRNGRCRFNASTLPAEHYGQSMSFAINPGSVRERVSQTILGLRNFVRGKAVSVPMYTLDTLISEFGCTDIVHVDAQGAELKVVEGATNAIRRELIDYWLIGVHKQEYNEVLRRMLRSRYECVVDLVPDSMNVVDGRTVECGDGIQLWKRRT